MAIKDILGKVVTITGNGEVGYGTSGDEILGVVTAIGKKGFVDTTFDNLRTSGTFGISSTTKTAIGATVDYVATVTWGRTFEEIPTNTIVPTVGSYLAVDGAGLVITSDTATNAKVISVDSTTKIATIKIS